MLTSLVEPLTGDVFVNINLTNVRGRQEAPETVCEVAEQHIRLTSGAARPVLRKLLVPSSGNEEEPMLAPIGHRGSVELIIRQRQRLRQQRQPRCEAGELLAASVEGTPSPPGRAVLPHAGAQDASGL